MASRVLIVVCHPLPTSLVRSAFDRVYEALKSTGAEIRVLDLDAEQFSATLTLEERMGHLGNPSDRPELQHHFEALLWCNRLILVYPTWFSGQPARMKGWFDRVWMNEVAWHLPEGANRIHAGLRNVRRIDIVTTHGSSRLVNFLQGNTGLITVSRTLRILCHPLCRVRKFPIYKLDRADEATITQWLDRLSTEFGAR